MEYILFLFSCFVLIKSSDILIDSASSIAIKLKVPKILIGLTIVAFGTCAPEIGISFISIANGKDSMALANIIGSCSINILLIIGLAAFLHPIKLRHATIKKELPFLVLITTIFSLLVLDSIFVPNKNNLLTRFDGFILLTLFLIFMMYLLNVIRNQKQEKNESAKYSFGISWLLFFVSLILILLSSDMLVESAVIIAKNWKISEKVITMFIIAIGTSLPELITTLQASKKNEYDMAIGNIIGTNIFNLCIVLGLPIVIFGEMKIIDFNIIDILFVLSSTIILYIFSKSGKILTKLEGIIMILLFISYYLYIFFI